MAQTIKMVIQLRRDTSANWELYKDIVPAAGEPCFVIDENILKIGDGVTTFENLEPINGSKFEISADGKSLVLEDSVLKLMGFDAAEVGAQPRKGENGLEWVVPTGATVEELQTIVEDLQSDVDGLKTIVGATDEGSGTILDRIESLETKMGTDDSTVDAKIDAKINEFANNISDDGTVNTLKELITYVANHGGEIDTIVSDIVTLQDLVGDEKVSDQIGTAVAGLVKAEDGKSLVEDTLIAKLEAIEVGAQVNKIEEIYVGDTLLEVVDKKVIIPVGAGLKTSDEIEVAEDGTLSIKTISFSKIAQEENEEIILSGGSAAG